MTQEPTEPDDPADEGALEGGVPVGAADVEEDKRASGADADDPTTAGSYDTGGTPVGSDDVEADARASGADPDRT